PVYLEAVRASDPDFQVWQQHGRELQTIAPPSQGDRYLLHYMSDKRGEIIKTGFDLVSVPGMTATFQNAEMTAGPVLSQAFKGFEENDDDSRQDDFYTVQALDPAAAFRPEGAQR